jgi:hypothetical protein
MPQSLISYQIVENAFHGKKQVALLSKGNGLKSSIAVGSNTIVIELIQEFVQDKTYFY